MQTEAVKTLSPCDVTDDTISSYRRDGFVRVRGIITPEEASEFRETALAAQYRLQSHAEGTVTESAFTQLINVWLNDDKIRRLTLHTSLAKAASALAGEPLRIWHDHTLIKQPKKSTPTEFHQDQAYWPHRNSRHPLSCWVALCDVPVERGCMSFIAGYQDRDELRPQNLADPNDLLRLVPEMAWAPRITVPLRAGDCTFHHGRTPHMAGANLTDDPRVAHVVIYIDAETIYDPSIKSSHVATRGRNLEPDRMIEGDAFPLVEDILNGRVK